MKTWIALTIFLLKLVILAGRSLAQETQEVQTEPNVTTATNFTEATVKLENMDYTNSANNIERSSHAHIHVDPTFKGFWAKKFAWRPRWVKTWQEKKVYVAVWKRMWGPMVVKEWVPVPKPPPGWVKHDAGSYIVKTPHH